MNVEKPEWAQMLVLVLVLVLMLVHNPNLQDVDESGLDIQDWAWFEAVASHLHLVSHALFAALCQM